MTDKEKLSELLNPWLAHLSLCAAGDLIEKGVTIPVRCKDCKHREESPWFDGYRCGNPDEGMASGVVLRDNDFCSYGERKDNGK